MRNIDAREASPGFGVGGLLEAKDRADGSASRAVRALSRADLGFSTSPAEG